MRIYLAVHGGGRKGNMSRFIDEALRTYLFEKAVAETKADAADLDEAVARARKP